MHASTSPISPALASDVLVDRRRPGRSPADPALVPLLRQTAGAGSSADDLFLDEGEHAYGAADQEEDGRLFRGIGFALLLSTPFWLFVAVIGRAVLR